ncbi:MAG: hypothetical protein [Bacteriophage sp.]|nr:MAG: hypothetical protein [Bacteriophage sp.]UWI08466.1 MAG: hypothetical protein [Bacteriophage sp.]
MAGTTKAAEKATQEPVQVTEEPKVEAKAEAKVYNLRSSNKYLTVSSLGVQFMAGKYYTTDPAVVRALMEIDGVDLNED